MIGLVVYLGLIIIAFVIVLKCYIESLEEIEELKKANEELLEINYKLTNKNGRIKKENI